MLKYALGVRKQLRDRWVVILWLAHVVKVSVICALSHGSPIIRTISSATYLKRSQKIRQIDKKRF